MSSLRTKCIIIVTLLAVICSTTETNAAFWGKVIRGLELFDFNFAVEKNFLGDGWTIDTAATYNNRNFDFGFAELTLTGSVTGSAGFTRRGIPKATFTLNSAGTPLSYLFEVKNGVQDYTAIGSVLIDIDTEINAIGSYYQTFQISNRGEFEFDGICLNDSGTLDFDVGPINVKGNIFLDALAAITQPFFDATATQNPFADLSGKTTQAAAMTKTINSLKARIDAGEALNEEELSALINNTILLSVLGEQQPADNLFKDLLLPGDFLKEPQTTRRIGSIMIESIPEPASLSLLAGGMLLIGTRRRR